MPCLDQQCLNCVSVNLGQRLLCTLCTKVYNKVVMFIAGLKSMYVDSGARGGDGTDQRVQLTSYLDTSYSVLQSCTSPLAYVPSKEVQMAVKTLTASASLHEPDIMVVVVVFYRPLGSLPLPSSASSSSFSSLPI